MTTYNGWTNYATWRVNLEIFDAHRAFEFISGGQSTRGRLLDLMTALRDMAEELVSETENSLARDYALAFLQEVNWREIASHMLENDSEDETAEIVSTHVGE